MSEKVEVQLSEDGQVWTVRFDGMVHSVAHSIVQRAYISPFGGPPFTAFEIGKSDYVKGKSYWTVVKGDGEQCLVANADDATDFTDKATAYAIAEYWNRCFNTLSGKGSNLNAKDVINAKYGKRAITESETGMRAFDNFALNGMETAIEMLKCMEGIPPSNKWTDLGESRFCVYYAQAIGLYNNHDEIAENARKAFLNGWESIRVAVLAYGT